MRLTTRIALAGTLLLIGTGASIAQEVYVQPRQRTIVREYIQVDPYTNQRTVVREREYIRQPTIGRPVIAAPYQNAVPYPNEVMDAAPRPPRNVRNIEAIDPAAPYLRDRPVVIEQRRVVIDPNDGHVVEVLE